VVYSFVRGERSAEPPKSAFTKAGTLPFLGWLMVSIHHTNQLSTLSIKTAPPVDSILFCQGRHNC
jgi:hypothetical protein